MGALCRAPKAEPPSGVISRLAELKLSLEPPGSPWEASVGRAGTGRECWDPGQRLGRWSRHGSRSWDRGAVAEPQQSVPECGYPVGGCAGPGKVSPRPQTPWHAEGSVAWGGDSAQGCCPGAWWEIPCCPSIISLPQQWLPRTLLGTSHFQRGVSIPLPPCPLPRDIPVIPGHPQSHPATPGRCRPSPGVPPGCHLRPSPSGSIIPEERREGNGKSLSFSTFSSQAGAGSPSPRALSGSPPCSLAPTGCSEQHPGAAAPQTLPSWASRARGGGVPLWLDPRWRWDGTTWHGRVTPVARGAPSRAQQGLSPAPGSQRDQTARKLLSRRQPVVGSSWRCWAPAGPGLPSPLLPCPQPARPPLPSRAEPCRASRAEGCGLCKAGTSRGHTQVT